MSNKATFIGFGYSGVAHYRCAMPAEALGEGLFIRDDKTLAVKKQVGTLEAPVIVYSQPWLDFQIEEAASILKGGGRLIVDVDDDLRVCMEKDDLLVSLDEEKVKRWEETLMAAHLVTCSTQHIADTLRKRLGVDTMVCPNAIDPERFNVRRFPTGNQTIVVGWAGGVGHREAFERIAPAIEQVMDARDDVAFVSIGEIAPGVLPSTALGKYAGSDRVHDAGFGGLYQYPALLSQFHIGLAPAVDNDFYRGKSDIRLLELAAAQVYPIVQAPTYSLPTPGTGAALPADATVQDWQDALMVAISDPRDRWAQGNRAYRRIAKRRTIASTKKAWRAAIDKALA